MGFVDGAGIIHHLIYKFKRNRLHEVYIGGGVGCSRKVAVIS